MNERDNIEKLRDCTAVVLDVSTLSDEEIDQLVELDNSIFPDMPVEKSEIVESLKSKGVQVALKNPEGKVVGLLTSLPHNHMLNLLVFMKSIVLLKISGMCGSSFLRKR